MIYLDNAATSFPKPAAVAEEMARFVREDAANPGRAGHRMAVNAEKMLDRVRLKIARLFDITESERVIFAMNCTDALNMAIKGVVHPINGEKPHVVTTVLEHNSVSRPLQAMVEAGELDVSRVDCDDDGFVSPDDIIDAMTDQTVLVVMTHASNVLGTIQDIATVGEKVRERGALFCVDAAQTAGIVPISVREMNIDLLAMPGHKSLYGPTGTGALYVGDRCPEPAEAVAATHEPGNLDQQITRRLRPWREGGTGGDSSTPTQPALYPYYLEGGTPNTIGIAGLGVALDYHAEHDMNGTLEHERKLLNLIHDRLNDDDRFTLYGPETPDQCVGTLCLNVEGYEASDVATILDDSFNIAVRSGLHCAPYIHKRLGTFPSGAVRISPGPWNTAAHITELLDALDQLV